MCIHLPFWQSIADWPLNFARQISALGKHDLICENGHRRSAEVDYQKHGSYMTVVASKCQSLTFWILIGNII